MGLYRARGHWDTLAKAGPALLIASLFAFAARSYFLRLDLSGPPATGLNVAGLVLTGGLYGWLVVYGSLGTALRFATAAGPVVRFLAESSYWVYLVHFPVVGLVQADLFGIDWPIAAKFWFPKGSICEPPIITCRRPDQTTSNIVR